MIPREFFVLEMNAVLPVTQYPPSQYLSRFSATKSLWETIVFPALAPQTRQQVLLLRQTLDKMRQALVTSASSSDGRSSRHVLAYTREEIRVYSLCFHELIRQIQCICKEQSELLREVRSHYDAALARLLDHVQGLERVIAAQQQQLDDVVAQHEHVVQARDVLLEQTLHAQATQQHALATATQSTYQCRSCQRRSGTGSESSSDASESDCDAEELAWRRQRRKCHQLERMQRARKRASLVEENLAAARLQSAYHKYHVRKEQHRLALRTEKHSAALEIQRSYRGFKQRQLTPHRRAVIQVIAQRRKEAAAVELLQANVRSYLLKQRRKDRERDDGSSERLLKPSVRRVSDALSRGSTAATGTQQSDAAMSSSASPEDSGVLDVPATRRALDLLVTRLRAGGGPSATLAGFLSQFGDLTLAIAELETQTESSTTAEHRPSDGSALVLEADTAEQQHSSEAEATRPEDGDLLDKDSEGATPAPPATVDFQMQLNDKIAQAEELVTLFHSAVRSLRASPLQRAVGRSVAHASDSDARALLSSASPTSKEPNSSERSNNHNEDDTDGESKATAAHATLCQATSTSSLDLHLLPFSVLADPNELDERSQRQSDSSPTNNNGGDMQSASATSAPVTVTVPTAPVASPRRTLTVASLETEHNGDFHLDETLWNTETNTVHLDELRACHVRNAALVRELLTSREAAKDLVWLKQFMSDTYDTVVGKLRDAPRHVLQQLVTRRCALALSLAEWQAQHSRSSSVAHERLDEALSFQLADIVHEHFHCQSGLQPLVQSGEARLLSCLERFRSVDPDVDRFYAFLHLERSHNEFLFYCVCRHLAALSASTETPDVLPTSPRGQRQPLLDADTMRDVIALPLALRVARTLFRVDDSDAIRQADARVVEIENAVYTRFQPRAAFDQFEAVLRAYFVDMDRCEQPDEDEQQQESYTRASPRRQVASWPSAVVRASNVHQFHSKQFHAVAPRSPRVRQRYPTPPEQQYRAGGRPAQRTQWIHFDDLVDLLLKYRTEMNHFHLFTRWVRDLYASAVTESAPSSPSKSSTSASASTPLLSETQFVETLAPYSLGPTERELANIFHNALKQRSLQLWMPPRVFTSVVLLLLRNGLVSVSNFRPQGATSTAKRASVLQGPSDERQWMRLAQRWRSRETDFERALETIYASAAPASDAAVAEATELLECRNELFQLFMTSAGSESLARAQELYEQLTARLAAHAPTPRDTIDLSRAYLCDDDLDDVDTSSRAKSASYEPVERTDRVRGREGREHVRRSDRDDDVGDASAWETDSTTA